MLGGPLRACSSPDLHQLRFPQIPPEFGAERPSASYQKLRRYQHEDLTRDKRGCFLRSRAAWCRGRTIRYRADYPNRLQFRLPLRDAAPLNCPTSGLPPGPPQPA